MTTGMVAEAVALTESGVLVNGLCATDLLSGLEVRAEPGVEDSVRDGPTYRGSGVALRKLESVRELVEEVLEARADDPELTSANPVTPRRVFPWGIGAARSDVLVVGPDKEVTASYLRVMGLRARTVDVARALRLSGDLAVARSDVADGSDNTGDTEDTGNTGNTGDTGDARGPDVPDRGSGGSGARPRVVVMAVVALAAVMLLGGALVVGPSGTEEVAGQVHVDEATPGTEPEPDQGPEPWREMHSGDRDGPDDAPGGEPAVSVAVDVAGWEVTETTVDREIWTSEDEGMRVLVAARPTPVDTQEELDTAMLGALDGLDGNGEVRVTNRSPVSYEEYFPESTTAWQVRLVDGHQVSVGCQYREFSADRREVCDQFGATARVNATTGPAGRNG